MLVLEPGLAIASLTQAASVLASNVPLMLGYVGKTITDEYTHTHNCDVIFTSSAYSA